MKQIRKKKEKNKIFTFKRTINPKLRQIKLKNFDTIWKWEIHKHGKLVCEWSFREWKCGMSKI